MIKPEELKEKYLLRQGEILRRLQEFEEKGKGTDAELLAEMAFCISAANSSAEAAFRAQQELAETGFLFSDDADAISAILLKSKVRFHKKKAEYLIMTRKKLFDSGELKRKLSEEEDAHKLRFYLVKEAKGIGYKEAAHYLRNIGRGHDFAILDRHIFRNLGSLGVLKRKPKSLTPKKYLAIEKRLRKFSKEAGIPMSHLDLLFWSEETGRIFK